MRAVGPGLIPLQAHLEATLAKPEFAKFLASGSAPAPGPKIHADGRPASVGDWIMGNMQRAAASAHSDARADMSRPFGLGNRPVPR